jgi:alkylation response protein AidB-like acyl-CoA dehydrogenase
MAPSLLKQTAQQLQMMSRLTVNGLTREYIAEKLFRDARATLIEDGTNECLRAHGGHVLYENYPRKPE